MNVKSSRHFTLEIHHSEQVNWLLQLGNQHQIKNVILGHQLFSRSNHNSSWNQLLEMSEKLKNAGFVTVFQWDVLGVQKNSEQRKELFESYFQKGFFRFIDRIRVQDVGVAHYLASKKLLIELLLETANHNQLSIQTWINHFQFQAESDSGEKYSLLKKIIFSIELDQETLLRYLANLNAELSKMNIETEILGLGAILLFYTPRYLLSGAQKKDLKESDYQQSSLWAWAHSEESVHKNFIVQENNHGMFMYHTKDFFILEKLASLFEGGLSSARIETHQSYWLSQSDQIHFWDQLKIFLQHLFLSSESIQSIATQFKSLYPRESMRGFFQINRSDILFPKLKNQKAQRQDDGYLGEVVDSARGEFIVMRLKGSFSFQEINESQNQMMVFRTPEGKEKKMVKSQFELLTENLLKINYEGFLPPKTQVYLLTS